MPLKKTNETRMSSCIWHLQDDDVRLVLLNQAHIPRHPEVIPHWEVLVLEFLSNRSLSSGRQSMSAVVSRGSVWMLHDYQAYALLYVYECY